MGPNSHIELFWVPLEQNIAQSYNGYKVVPLQGSKGGPAASGQDDPHSWPSDKKKYKKAYPLNIHMSIVQYIQKHKNQYTNCTSYKNANNITYLVHISFHFPDALEI